MQVDKAAYEARRKSTKMNVGWPRSLVARRSPRLDNTPVGYIMFARRRRRIMQSQRAQKRMPGKALMVDSAARESNLRRLRRIEGQVRGLHKMVEGDRYCPDILMQISAVHEALRTVGQALMRNHLKHCATHAITHGTEAEVEATYNELLRLIYKHAR